MIRTHLCNYASTAENKRVSFHGKHEMVWVTPNISTVEYIYMLHNAMELKSLYVTLERNVYQVFKNSTITLLQVIE